MQNEQQVIDAINAAVPADVAAAAPAPAAAPAAIPVAATAEPAQAPDVKNKKKPGRPKKKVVSMPVDVYGIVDKPVNADDVIELVYCNPTLFKKIFALQKAFAVSEIEMIFDPTGLKIITTDHLKKSTIYASIDGRCMNLYYCKGTIRICVKRDSIEKVLSCLTKNHYKITFLLKENYRSTLYLIVKESEYNSDTSYEIDVGHNPQNAPIAAADDDTNYPIKFKLSSKYFKTTIGNIRKLSTTFTIQKTGNDPLQLTYDKAQGVNFGNVYSDTEKINLVCTLTPDDVFSVSVCIDYIKPFSNSTIGDDVYIAADKRDRMSFATQLDKKDNGWAATVKIYTDINNYQPKEYADAKKH